VETSPCGEKTSHFADKLPGTCDPETVSLRLRSIRSGSVVRARNRCALVLNRLVVSRVRFEAFDSQLSLIEEEMIGAAKAIPADKYDFGSSAAIFRACAEDRVRQGSASCPRPADQDRIAVPSSGSLKDVSEGTGHWPHHARIELL
jgi:hypothetical protein